MELIEYTLYEIPFEFCILNFQSFHNLSSEKQKIFD